MDISHNLQYWLEDKANKTLEWIPSDTLENFEKKLAKDPNDQNMQYYLENPIRYKMNNMGFRTAVDFVDGVEGNLFLGCSHTMGIGHYLRNIWAWKLNEYIGGNFLNAGVGGSGIGTAFRLLYGLKGMIRPKNVFLFTPHGYRYEYFNPDLKAWTTLQTTRLLARSELFRTASAKNNMEIYYYLNYIGIKDICESIGANLYAIDDIDFKVLKTHKGDIPQTARDYHLPVANHHRIFERFKQAYDNNEPPSSKRLAFAYSVI